MRKEIGGYIEFEHYSGMQFHENAVKLNCARNCLAYLIQVHEIKKIYIPYFLCDSIWKTCKRYGVDFSFYHITEDFQPIIPDGDFEKDWLYVVNYYGQISNDDLKRLHATIPNLIVDNVQAFFQMPVENISTIYSCRKFFGVPDGAYLYTDKLLLNPIEMGYSYNRMGFLLGRFEKTANEFYAQFRANDDSFEEEPIKLMSLLTENLLCSLNYKKIAEQRTQNFLLLHEKLKTLNKLRLENPYGAFSYPLLIEKGCELRSYLQKQNVYIPTLWSDVFGLLDEKSLECKYSKNILPLPIDQRYGEEEMIFLVNKIVENVAYERKQ